MNNMQLRKMIVLLAILILILIGKSALSEGKVLKLPAGLKTIEAEVFMGDSSLEEVIVPDGVTEINKKAFAKSTLKKINIPSSVGYIAQDAFEGLETINIIANQGSYAYHWGVINQYIEIPLAAENEFLIQIVDSDKCIITKYIGIANYIRIPNSIEGYKVIGIGQEAFRSSNIILIDLPASISSIDYQAFYSCSRLEEIRIPEGVTTIGAYAFYWCTELKKVTLPETLTAIGQSAFGNCTSITEIHIPDSVST
ncbi:MAG: leucine-rich repeat domain-containing protein, partial [Clostridia bacterium]|nr:leucine-rich repeat domain-containing protein [Clostridia bacterium]